NWSQLCRPGYEGTPGSCRPVCNPQCVYAVCTAPQQCTCDAGYETSGGREARAHGCRPICQGCHYGDCIAPGLCHCWPAFAERADEGCQPLPDLLLPPQNCQNNCGCWQTYPRSAFTAASCISACDRYNPEPCLDLSQCLCNRINHFLVCTHHNATQQYVCAQQTRATSESDELERL
ncbi:hypothetical protein KR093_003766, partial [Drosophila rubida]